MGRILTQPQRQYVNHMSFNKTLGWSADRTALNLDVAAWNAWRHHWPCNRFNTQSRFRYPHVALSLRTQKVLVSHRRLGKGFWRSGLFRSRCLRRGRAIAAALRALAS